MKKNILPFASIILFGVLLTSCRKDDILSDTSNLYDNLKLKYQSPEQLFVVNAATGGSIKGAAGTKITFPSNWAVNLDGTAFTGDAVVTLKESLKKSQWIMDGVSAANQNDVLLSGGMLRINVTRKDNGAELKPAPAMQKAAIDTGKLANVIKGEVPRKMNVLGDLQLFLPDSISNQSTAAPIGWTPASYYPFGTGPNSYVFQIPKFRWVNCDGLWNQPGAKTTINVTPNLSAFAGATNVQAMFVYRNINTVITLPPQSGGFFQSYTNSIAVGSVADIVCIGKAADGKILFKVMPANTFTALQNISITPAIATAAEVETYLNTINN